MEWFYIMISLSCFFNVAYTKLNWPTESLIVYAILMIYPLFQWLQSFSSLGLKRMKWNLNLLHFQQKKIRTLEKTVDSLKADNRLLTDEITGLHKMWMEQPAAVPSSKKPTKEEILNSEIILAQIEYSEGIEILPKEPKKTPIYRQETDFIDKSPL